MAGEGACAGMSIGDALAQAVQHHRAGRLAEAADLYRRVLEAVPDQSDALHLLGLVAKAQGQPQRALELIGRSLAVRPDAPEVACNLANLLKSLGRLDEAVDAYRRALDVRPDYRDALFSLAVTLHGLGRQEAAIPLYQRVIALEPGDVDAVYDLGVAHQNIGQLDAAVTAYRQAIGLRPDHAVAWSNLSATLRHQARLDAAVDAGRRALALDPGLGEAAKNLAFALLLQGDYREGLERYEGRRRAADGTLPEIPAPEWDGAPLDGQTILLLAEQGLGDTLQMIRYARPVAARGGQVLVVCPAPLVRLLGGVAGVDRLVPRGEPVPRFHTYAPMMSLPRLLGTTVDTIPADVPYIAVEPAAAAAWAERLGPRDGSLRVGVVWAGNPGHRGDRLRSHRLAAFLPLMAVPGVRFFGLQLGVGRRDLDEVVPPPTFTDLGPGIGDFADTAAIIANLDLVIAVDTSVAHLAGAMGKPVWIVLPRVPDWRWLMDRGDSPWYPSARLFRQDDTGDADLVFARMAAALRERTAASRERAPV